MDKIQQIEFINELIENVKRDVLSKCNKFPEHWDGRELRWYIADKFNDAQFKSKEDQVTMRARIRNFKNDVLVDNL